MALQLKNNGITRVRPLLGGIEHWVELRFPLEQIAAGEAGSAPTPAPPTAPADPAASD